MIVNKILNQTFLDLSIEDRITEIDNIYSDLFEQVGTYSEGKMFMPFCPVPDNSVGLAVASLGEDEVLAGKSTSEGDGLIEFFSGGKSYTVEKIFCTLVH